MDLQLVLLPQSYYNTLGFDPELIDYVDHIDDSFLDQLIDPLYDRRGRQTRLASDLFPYAFSVLH